ncbi:MAG TPA: nitrite/sulfite reductase, partial [Solirubrobacteraceae bacterium]|nr:nitrite/sulfite reductase [Solirubrobacteraceae bacterium]
MEPSTTVGRQGTLENPEVREDVPGHVIPILEREFDDFDTESQRYLRGELTETEFIGFRLKQGVYGQRQPDRQMIRVKLPFGAFTADQLDAFGRVAEEYAPLRKGHITTRQNFQFHHIPLTDAQKVLRILGEVGLSSREACGNTVRNVTGDPWAGVCDDEPYDITPYGAAFVRHFVRHPDYQLMPRKFKVAFTSSDADRAITLIHDLGFIPRVRDGVKGVEINTGGGTSIMARVGATLYEFVEVDNGDYLRVSEAVMRIFNRQDW